ncbi:MAG: hypothetical protein Q7R81_00540 [Candidatus Peregrinibacteria bacterium]|nr:hypothetical protein [Candidatus Peregrinibacteria bacterium]
MISLHHEGNKLRLEAVTEALPTPGNHVEASEGYTVLKYSFNSALLTYVVEQGLKDTSFKMRFGEVLAKAPKCIAVEQVKDDCSFTIAGEAECVAAFTDTVKLTHGEYWRMMNITKESQKNTNHIENSAGHPLAIAG